MTVKELIEKLQEFHSDIEVKVQYDPGYMRSLEIEDIISVHLDGDYSEECNYEHVILEAKESC